MKTYTTTENKITDRMKYAVNTSTGVFIEDWTGSCIFPTTPCFNLWKDHRGTERVKVSQGSCPQNLKGNRKRQRQLSIIRNLKQEIKLLVDNSNRIGKMNLFSRTGEKWRESFGQVA